MHLGGHELACGHNHVFTLLAGKVTVDVLGVLEEVRGVTLQVLHLLQGALKLLRLLDHLQRGRVDAVTSLSRSYYAFCITCMLPEVWMLGKALATAAYHIVALQLAALGGDGVDQTLGDDAVGQLLPDHLS